MHQWRSKAFCHLKLNQCFAPLHSLVCSLCGLFAILKIGGPLCAIFAKISMTSRANAPSGHHYYATGHGIVSENQIQNHQVSGVLRSGLNQQKLQKTVDRQL
jgi:hypothetical protein